MKVSVIGIGTWQFGGEWGKDFSPAEVSAILAAGADCGINLIDTAECYGDHESERLIGQAVEGHRSDWVLATKFGHRFTGILKRSEPRTPADVLEQLNGSLQALRTDYIDLYQYHSWGDDTFFDEDVLSTLLKARDAGKFRHLGNSVKGGGAPRQVAASAQRQIECIQVVYNRLNCKAEEDALPACLRQNLGVLARVPLASGWLTGKYKPGVTFPPNDTRSRQKPMTEDDPRNLELKRAMAEVPGGVDTAAWALAWCLKHPAVTAVIPGCKTAEQVRKNAAAGDMAVEVHPQGWA